MGETTDPIRVLHILGRMETGGIQIRLLELIGRLRPHEFQVDVCAVSGLAGSFDGRVRALGGDVIPLQLKNPWFPWRFARLLRQGRYSVVHSQVLYASGPILALAARAGVPVRIAHFHNTSDGWRATWRRQAKRSVMRRLIDRYATDVVACGEGAMDAIWGDRWRNDARCRVIYASLDPAPFEQPVDSDHVRADLGIPIAARIFVHVGRLAPAKNHRRLLSIFAEIRKMEPASWLVLVGADIDDPDGETARGIRELGIQDRVLGLGVRDDVPRLITTADALLLPSLWEGLPAVLLEACAAGVPALATDLPGVREIASRLSLVRCLPLSASDREWASAALALPADAARLRLRESAADSFRRSVFHVDRAVEAHRAIWRRGVESRALART